MLPPHSSDTRELPNAYDPNPVDHVPRRAGSSRRRHRSILDRAGNLWIGVCRCGTHAYYGPNGNSAFASPVFDAQLKRKCFADSYFDSDFDADFYFDPNPYLDSDHSAYFDSDSRITIVV